MAKFPPRFDLQGLENRCFFIFVIGLFGDAADFDVGSLQHLRDGSCADGVGVNRWIGLCDHGEWRVFVDTRSPLLLAAQLHFLRTGLVGRPSQLAVDSLLHHHFATSFFSADLRIDLLAR